MYFLPLNCVNFQCLCVSVDDVRAEADYQQEGAGAAAGHGQSGQLPKPAGPAEWHDGSRRAQSDGPAHSLPAAPRPRRPSGYGQKSWPLQGPVGPPPPKKRRSSKHTDATSQRVGERLRLDCCPLEPQVRETLSALFCNSLRGCNV